MGICPIASKVGHVTLATPPLGSFIVPYVVLDMAYPTKKTRKNVDRRRNYGPKSKSKMAAVRHLDLLRHHIGPPTKSFHWSTSACQILC